MKKLLSIFVILCSFNVFAYEGDIIAVVNDKPITRHEFDSRKKMAIILNNINPEDAAVNKTLNKSILNILIEEELLNQHAAKMGSKTSDQDINNAIATIEKRNNMPEHQLLAYLREKGVDVKSFKSQIKGELIKYNIISSLAQSVSVSPDELDVAIIDSGAKDFNIEALMFTAKNNDESTINQMAKLKSQIKDCAKIEEKLYKGFAVSEKLKINLSQLDSRTASVIEDTKIGFISSIYQDNGKYKMVLVCKKSAIASGEDVNRIKSFLSNKKMSKKAEKFFKDLRTSADIKIMMH